jgi:hypothetical protein
LVSNVAQWMKNCMKGEVAFIHYLRNNLIFIWIMNEILKKLSNQWQFAWRMEFWKGKSHNEWKFRQFNLQNGQK